MEKPWTPSLPFGKGQQLAPLWWEVTAIKIPNGQLIDNLQKKC